MPELTLDERILDAMTEDQIAECLEYCFYSRVRYPFLKGLVGKNELTEFDVGQFALGLVRRDEEAIPITRGYDYAKERKDALIMTKVQKATDSTLFLFHRNWETASAQQYFEDHFSHFLVFIEDVEATDCRDVLQQICIDKKPKESIAFGLLYTCAKLCEIARDGDVKLWADIYDGKPEIKYLGLRTKRPAALSLLYSHEPSLAQRFPDFVEYCTHQENENDCSALLTGILKRYKRTFPAIYPERLIFVKNTLEKRGLNKKFEATLQRLNQMP